MKSPSVVEDIYKESLSYYIRYSCFPPGFDAYYLADERGWTFAHYAACHGILPDWFRSYDWADHSGWTVGHQDAISCTLPEWFDDWYAEDQYGLTVIQRYVNSGIENRIDRKFLFALKIRLNSQLTVAEYILDKNNHIKPRSRDRLEAEVLAWMASREIEEIHLGRPGCSFKLKCTKLLVS